MQVFLCVHLVKEHTHLNSEYTNAIIMSNKRTYLYKERSIDVYDDVTNDEIIREQKTYTSL